ncbi:MAG TPA: LuxR C-terminal-related transcriptional regulator, partial [Anaerolineaceae bacterium]|nr:LuxR C-terminal-related transcriptional regulator [Anaerolineaceae bacterium]
ITELILRNNLAFLLYACGRIAEALEICREGVSWFLNEDGSPSLLAGIPYIPLGCILYELGETEQAYPLLMQSLNFTQRLGLYEILAAPANQVLVQLLADQGQMDEALALAKEVRRRSEKIGLAAVVKEADFWQANLYTRQDRAEQSAGILARYGLDCSLRPPEHVSRALLAARVAGARGEFAPAAEMLALYAEHLQASGNPVELSRTRLEQARLAMRAGDQEAAISFLRQALGLAAGLGFRQMFVPALPELAPLLRRVRAESPAFVDLLLASKEPARAAVETLIEPPGEREIEILRLVAGGCSNQQIADRLYITVGTVKWYLNQLFGKLAVNRRTEAVARAVELGLI